MMVNKARKFVIVPTLLIVAIVIFALIFRIQKAEARWRWVTDYAVNPVRTCQNGMYIGVGSDETDRFSIDFLVFDTGELIAELSDRMPEDPIPDQGIIWHDFYVVTWSPLQSVGTDIEVETSGDSVERAVEDCLIDPIDTLTGTGFTYQGSLEDAGSPANGAFDFRFRLFDAASDGAQVGADAFQENVPVSDGLFTTEIDFGQEPFTGAARWLETSLKPAGAADPFTPLTPRQPLTSVPYALNANTLRIGAVVTGSSEDSALTLENTLGNGLDIPMAAHGIAISDAGGDGVVIDHATDNGLRIKNAGFRGVHIGTSWLSGITLDEVTAGPGVSIGSAATNGLRISSAGWSGVSVASAGQAGISIGTAGQDGVFIGTAGQEGVSIGTAGHEGVSIGTAGDDGFKVTRAGNPGTTTCTTSVSGLEVCGSSGYGIYAGEVVTGVHILDAAANGLEVGTAGADGVEIQDASEDGLEVQSAGADGVEIWSASANGVDVTNAALDGLRIESAGDDGIHIVNAADHGMIINRAEVVGARVLSATWGMVVDDATEQGLHVLNSKNGIVATGSNFAGIFSGDISVSGSCTGCAIAAFGVNSGGQTLEPGDIVSISGSRINVENGSPILLEVGSAQDGGTPIGVVQGQAYMDTINDPLSGESVPQLVPGEGNVEPGAFLTIITYGPAQINASALEGAINVGQRLTTNPGGMARTLKSVEINGVRLAEDAPVLGIALSRLEAGQEGQIWIMVNPQ